MSKLKFLFLLPLFAGLVKAEKILTLPLISQEQSLWCWAASSETVLKYYGQNVSQYQIAQTAYHGVARNMINFLYTDSDTSQYNLRKDGKTYYPLGVNAVLKQYHIQTKYISKRLSYQELQNSISTGAPFFAFWTLEQGGGHIVVCFGWLENQMVEIMNPYYGDGFVVMKYSYFAGDRRYRKHYWTGTLLIK